MENLLECKGRSYKATLGLLKQTEVVGKIQVENNFVFLCQDHRNGSSCLDKLGYKFSWFAGDGSNLEDVSVFDLQLLDEEPKTNTEEKAKEIYESMFKGTSTYTQAKEASLIAVGYIERALSDLGEYDVEYWNEVKLELGKL